MTCRSPLFVCVSIAVLLLGGNACLTSFSLGADPHSVSYNRDIRPLLSDRCFHCHGPDGADRQADLRLDQSSGEQGAYREADGTVALKPGSLDESEFWRRITSDNPDVVMPPPDSHKKPLSQEEQEQFRQWIEQGAKYESFWAFIPPKSIDLPKPDVASELGVASQNATSSSPIDTFVLGRLAEEGLVLAAKADRRTLLRRVTLDLTGLPPTREELNNFLHDESPNAYEKLVDRLLDNPHYGEHMAKFWLDLVRFADTNGIHHDHYREQSAYRDWVIRSFNENLPYSDFARYQLAGDLYENPQRDQLIASGFHRLHLIIDRGTMLPEESFSRNVLDRVSSVGTAFLGLTLQCAVCHDHKYDPITARDFYALAGFFNNIDAEPETGGRRGIDFQRGLQEPYVNLTTPEQAQRLSKLQEDLDRLNAEVADCKKKVAELELEAIPPSDSAKGALGETAKEAPGSVNQQPEQPSLSNSQVAFKEATAALSAAEKRLEKAQKTHDDFLLNIPAAMVMKERSDVRPSHILIRGAYDNPGESVERATPAFLPPMKVNGDVKSRMDLANWLVDPENPLPARVAVNRFWQQLFGIGIVRTSEDFGAQGEWPSHPELLDYLAVRFVDSGWDVKLLMKEMLMSQAYQQSSVASPAAYQRDPNNRLLARGARFRLDSEAIRDQILASSGLLNPELFGKSVKPPQPVGLWTAVTLPSSYPHEYTTDTGDKIYRRSVYTFWKRAMPPPQMTIFNAPNREECIARRERTNTPLQALLLLNEAEYFKAARHLATHTLSTLPDGDEQKLSAIYEAITSQLPDQPTQAALLSLARDLKAMYAQSPELLADFCRGVDVPEGIAPQELAAWTMVASAVYNLDITKTRQ